MHWVLKLVWRHRSDGLPMQKGHFEIFSWPEISWKTFLCNFEANEKVAKNNFRLQRQRTQKFVRRVQLQILNDRKNIFGPWLDFINVEYSLPCYDKYSFSIFDIRFWLVILLRSTIMLSSTFSVISVYDQIISSARDCISLLDFLRDEVS